MKLQERKWVVRISKGSLYEWGYLNFERSLVVQKVILTLQG